MKVRTPFAVVLRLSSFRLSQADLEARLKAAVERYSPEKGGYAQVSAGSEQPDWRIVDDLLRRHGPGIKALRDSGEVESIQLDLAFALREGALLGSYIIPAQTAALAGLHGIDVELSIYLTAP